MKMVRCYQRKKIIMMRRADPVKASKKLPFDIITEILTWLPIDSLVRFKRVCKNWYFLIVHDRKFIAKHMERTCLLRLRYVCKHEANKLTVIFDKSFGMAAFCAGLVLEKSLTNSQVFRIRNPATHQVLYLPNAHEGTRNMDFALNPSTHECKLVCFYGKDSEVGFEVLTIGKDEQWRPMKHPNTDLLKHRGKPALQIYRGSSFKCEGRGHFVQVTGDGQDWNLKIHSLDILSECFITNTVPRGFYGNWWDSLVFYWNDCVAVADIGEEKLTVLVLEDYKQHKWSKKTVRVTFSEDHITLLKDPFFVINTHSDGLNFHFKDRFIHYDLKRETIEKVNIRLGINFCLVKPSLIALKGMKTGKVACSI
ncbi:hypothetical protein L3X38_023938 [Prunus dulcis]|uniref:F-box domain-containing protein n=1 Tax=Prunus dulcis TaxID=3755 RepID=A0AAD4VZN8_PRUDU|nr:hypothetical protein L3X38_023938 [Prunus dulcis]